MFSTTARAFHRPWDPVPRDPGLRFPRVSMGVTVSRNTAKNLAVSRKNERILTVSRKKMLTVKNLTTKWGLDIFYWVWCVMRLCVLVAGIKSKIEVSKESA